MKDLINGRYRIKSTLGTGGMGTIHLAEDRAQENRLVALKLVTPDGASPSASTSALDALVSEFETLARLRHPHLPIVHDFGRIEGGGGCFISMEYIRGRELLAAARTLKTAESYYWQSLAYNELAGRAFSRLAQLPPSAEMHELTAEIHRSQGRHREAVKEWQEALKSSPEDPRLRRELAVSLHQSRDFQAAQALLQDLIKAEPNSVELNFLLGDTLLNLQQGEKSIPFLKKAVQQDPALLPAQASLARAYLQIGAGNQAIPHLQAALPIDDDGSLHFQLARAYQAAGQQELAKQTLQKYQEISQSSRAQRQKLEQEIQIIPPQ